MGISYPSEPLVLLEGLPATFRLLTVRNQYCIPTLMSLHGFNIVFHPDTYAKEE
jgi:hypothetical protein